MDLQKTQQYKSAFDAITRSVKYDNGNTIEVWYARELQTVLGYARWENFVGIISRALESCKTQGISIDDHFREITKMIVLAKGAQRDVQDFMLTRYACYLIAQNGDPKKEEIAFAQSYFAEQTRKAELIEEHMNVIVKALASRPSYTFGTNATCCFVGVPIVSFIEMKNNIESDGQKEVEVENQDNTEHIV